MKIYIFEQNGDEAREVSSFDIDKENISFNPLKLKGLLGLTKGIKSIKIVVQR